MSKANKKADNTRRKLLAYCSMLLIQAMQNGKVDFEQFSIDKR
jgi:hypothetical protein